MSLRQSLENSSKAWSPGSVNPRPVGYIDTKVYQELKSRVHRKLLDRVDLAKLEAMPAEQMKAEITSAVEKLLTEETLAINESEHKGLIIDIQHEVFGLGPLESLMADPRVSDILVNTYRQVYVEREGQLELTDVRFESDAHLLKIIDKIVSAVGRRVDESSPMVDARLPDGSRVNAIIRWSR